MMAVIWQAICAQGVHVHAHTCTHSAGRQADTHPVLCPLGGVGVIRTQISGEKREIALSSLNGVISLCLPQEGRREESEKGGV